MDIIKSTLVKVNRDIYISPICTKTDNNECIHLMTDNDCKTVYYADYIYIKNLIKDLVHQIDKNDFIYKHFL